MLEKARAAVMKEMLHALAEELEMRSREKRLYRISEAVDAGPSGDGHLYSLRFKDGVPGNLNSDARISIKTWLNAVGGSVVDVDDPHVNVLLQREIPVGELCRCQLEVDNSALVEALRQRIESVRDRDSLLPDAACFGGTVSGEGWSGPLEESLAAGLMDGKINASQVEAVRACLERSFVMVWGPPGTGKTFTLSKLVECLVRAGRKVLVVSHANVAVDEAAARTCAFLKDSVEYAERRILRLGNVTKADLFKTYPCLAYGDAVKKEQASCDAERAEVEEHLHKLEKTCSLFSELEKVSEELRRAETSRREARITREAALHAAEEASSRRDAIHRDIDRLLDEIEKLRAVQTPLWSWFCRLRLERRRKRLDTLQCFAHYAEDTLQEAERALKQAERGTEDLERTLADLENKREQFIREIGERWPGANPDDLLKEKAQLASEIKELDRVPAAIPEKVLDKASAVFTTLAKCSLDKNLSKKVARFDVCVVDEASMAPRLPVYWAACLAREALVIVGDFLQLRPVHAVSKESADKYQLAEKWFGENVYDMLGITGDDVTKILKRPEVRLLDTQNRMHPAISAIVNEHIYGGCLKDGDAVRDLAIQFSLSSAPIVVLDTSRMSKKRAERKEGETTGSWQNKAHQAAVIALIRAIRREHPDPKSLSIGVATPYRLQANRLEALIRAEHLEGVFVATVHRFQGGEKDVIIFDTVASGNAGGFMTNDRLNPEARILFNVAVTRAKRQLWIVADRASWNRLKRSTLIGKVILAARSWIDAKDILEAERV